MKKKLNVFTENSDFLNLRFISNQHIEKKNLQMNHSSLFTIVFFLLNVSMQVKRHKYHKLKKNMPVLFSVT